MKKTVWLWSLSGFSVTSLLGTLLHFIYEWTGASVAAVFSGVNESTWEHIKLLFWPMFVFSLVQFFFFREKADFWCIKLRSMLIGLSIIPLLFYMYNGVIGKSPDFINIGIFFVAAALSFVYENIKFNDGGMKCHSENRAFLILCLIGLLFVVFTFITPEIAIFLDPVTGKYGI